jgi:NAD(P)-dependent dehydrogenase (short-subunit alcohol dehydrogenase family)
MSAWVHHAMSGSDCFAGYNLAMSFQGKRIVVTGGANGIGLAISKGMAAAGGSVWILDLAAENPADAASAIGAQACIADVTDRTSLERAFETVGVPDVVVVNAGIGDLAPLHETTTGLWERTLAVNLSGSFHTLQIAAEKMKPGRKGSIVLMASTNSFDGEANLIAYNATKAGLLGLLHTAANELGPYGIRINAVCPGLIRTRLTAGSFSKSGVISDYFAHVALGRGGEPEEVAQAVLFLASDFASYITGTTLVVDGGQLASKFGTWGKENDNFDGQRWIRKAGE